ncbi:unnamed protein product [Adineta steineri]|uniref:Tubulin--tyrosine ligase-like protein 5 n=1 Tax=Adineta steineri TaxID=433720 RepID=A0A814HQF2_9BILA|nr:unnamed protein product [Adineta steineri]CAF1051899.1 unnamed protein product [Adineta steineri]
MTSVVGNVDNCDEIVPRSSSVDSAIGDGGDDSPDEILECEEESFDELNEDNQQNGQCKALIPRLIRYGLKRTPIIQFSPKVVYGRCPEAKKIGEKHSLTFKFVKNDTKLIRNILEGHGFREVHPASSEFNILWTGGGMKPFSLRSLNPFQRVNHFPRSYEMTRKDRLYKNVQKMQQEKGVKNFNFIPTTFLLPYEFEDFSAAFHREKGVWIIKPVASSQGKGIFLINHPDQVPLDENLVISRYIDNPLLIDGYKFDVRIYVAVTSYDPLVAYLYEEGLTRFATVKYDPNCRSIKNAFMHLTNYSVNKRSHRYVRCDDPDIEDFGNKWSMSAMLRLLKAEGKDTFSLMMAIEDVCIKTLLSVESQISAACRMFLPTRGNCFEVYGFDILIDDDLRPWVLEVNLSPSLGCDAPIDLKIKTHMICDLFNLTSMPCIDPAIYSNKLKQQNKDSNLQSDQFKRRRPISAGYSLTPTLTNPNSNSRGARATTANRQSRSGNNNNNTNNANNNNNNNQGNEISRGEYFGLSPEEIRILRTVKEENRQRGGFVRIFPVSDTFEYFSSFFEQRTTSYNQMIHQRLYPSRWSTSALNSQQNPTGQIRRTTIPRSKHLSSAFNYGHSSEKDLTPKTSGCDLDEALERYRIYERRLIDIVPPPSTLTTITTTTTAASDIMEQPKFSEKISKPQIVIDSIEQNQSRINLHRTVSAPINHIVTKQQNRNDSPSKRLASVGQLVKQQQLNTNTAPGENRHSVYAKNDILQMLNQGLTLSPLQARTAFGTYLQRIQFRLMLDSEFKEEVTSTQHMDLVIRFLKRAGQNLSPPFRVEIPSRRLSQSDQKRILAKELCDFLHLYNKETVTQYQNQIFSTNQIDNRLFENFLRSASEADLEQMMTAYMKTNPNSAVHLGVNPKLIKATSQNSDVGADQHAQTILPKHSIEEKSITIIQTITSNDQSSQSWATLSTQNQSQRRLSRTSSATKNKNNQKKQDEIYKLYGVSRPVSAAVPQRKQLTATGSSIPGTKLLTRERPNSALLSVDQDNKRDFVEQLNELSTKQHRRQYSGIHRLNTFNSRSPSAERQHQQTNLTISNDYETTSQITATTTTKEEEVLEKSRQMLEESKAKNEQLAEQAKVFQRTLQRNEMYSALNRFGHRPPIYPTVVKETRTSSSNNKYQQSKNNNSTMSMLNDQHRIKSTNSPQD